MSQRPSWLPGPVLGLGYTTYIEMTRTLRRVSARTVPQQIVES